MDGWQLFVNAFADGQIVYSAIVLVTIFLILTGKLQWHTEKERWFKAWEKSDEANRALVRQNSDLVDANKTAARVIEALPRVGDSS